LAQEAPGGEPGLRHAFFSYGRDSDATRHENDADSGFSAGLEKLNFAESRVLSIGQTEASTEP
jgi:hypothetical protein